MDYQTSISSRCTWIAQEYLTLGQSDTTTFWPKVQSLTQQVIALAQEILAKEIPELASSDIAVATTGSDSRLEKCGLGSPVELIVITPSKVITDKQQATIDTIKQVCSRYSELFYSSVELKRLDQDRVSFYGEKTVIPTRAFDAIQLAGDPGTFSSYKETLSEELKTLNLTPFKKAFLRRALSELTKAIENKNGLIDLSDGKIQYNKKGGRGGKHDILRAIQYSVALKIFLHVQPQQFSQIPQTVLERLSWLRTNNLITLTDQEYYFLIETYTQTSIWYAQLNALAYQQPEQDSVHLQVPIGRARDIVTQTKEIC